MIVEMYIHAYPNYQSWALTLRLAHPSETRVYLLYILHLHSISQQLPQPSEPVVVKSNPVTGNSF